MLPFTLALPKVKHLRIYSSNKICTKSVWGKWENFDERNQRRTK